MKLWRQHLSPRLRERVLSHYLVPDSRFGLAAGLVPHLPQGKAVTVVDIGANRGEFTSAVQAHCGIERAVLVEPQPSRCFELSARYPQARFQVCNCALSERDGVAELQVLTADSCSSLLTVRPEAGFAGRQIDVQLKEQISVRLSTLDGLLSELSLDTPIDVLKIDTQGTELHVLRGARQTLRRVRLLWIEVSFRSLYEGSALFPEIHEFLRESGCRLYSLHEVFRGADQELLQADALFLGPTA